MKSVVALALGTLCGLLGYASESHAYFLATAPGQTTIDYTRPTRILLSGRGTDLGGQPQESAMGSALLYRQNFPNDQIVLLSVFENSRNEPKLLKAGWTIEEKNDLHLETQSATAELKKFSKIQSLEFFGHNSPSLGTQADGLGFRFDFREPVVATLAPMFMPGAFGFIHGCNSGWIIAPELSRIWSIPVAAALTETRFERLHSDGHFYVASATRAPSEKWATTNPDLGTPCDAGGCLRMRPAYSAYKGHWGDFAGPILSHYKFFCHLGEKECEKRMASALYGFVVEKSLKPDAKIDAFKQAAREFLCPVYKDRKITNECLTTLAKVETGKGNRQASFVVNNKQLACSFAGCQAEMTCTDHICSVTNQVSNRSTTLTDE